MKYSTFVRYNVVGGFLWGVGVTLLGYWFGQIDFVAEPHRAIAILGHRRHLAGPDRSSSSSGHRRGQDARRPTASDRGSDAAGAPRRALTHSSAARFTVGGRTGGGPGAPNPARLRARRPDERPTQHDADLVAEGGYQALHPGQLRVVLADLRAAVAIVALLVGWRR